MADAERRGDLNRAAELRYGTLHAARAAARGGERRASPSRRARRGMLKEEVDEEDIAEVVAKWTGIPVTRLLEGEVQKLVQMEERLARARGRAGRRRSARSRTPCGAAALGPVRPEPAHRLVPVPRPDRRRQDRARAGARRVPVRRRARDGAASTCREYMEKHTVARLIGAPPGYVGYEEGGQLTEAVRRRPYSVVLFDEIEKAHPDVFNVLLQVLDDGRLTDGQGRTVDFRNTVVIMTSNLGQPPLPRGRRPGQGARRSSWRSCARISGPSS